MIDQDTEDKLYELISQGNYPSIACQALGISQSRYSIWMRRGENKDRNAGPTPELVRFALRMREAEAKAETTAVKQITAQIEKNPELGLKFLGRRFSERWGEKKEINVSWTIRAVEMIKSGEVTLEALEAELGSQLTDKVKALLEAPQTIDGEFSVVKQDVRTD
mgnify:CR=1 FL=1